jgi:MFS family permease
MRRLFAHHDTRTYLAAQMLQLTGDSVLWLAMGIWVKMITGSNSAAGLTFFAYICGLLLGPLGGVVVDRFRRRLVLMSVQMLGAGWVCLLLAAGADRLWLVYVVIFGYGAMSSVGVAAQTALLPEIAPDDLLGEANSVLQMAAQGLRIVTPLVGAGLLVSFGPVPVILLTATLFLLASLGLLAVRHREAALARPPEARLGAELTAGARFIGRTPALRRLVTAGVISLLSFGIYESLVFAVVDDGLHRPPAFLGVLSTTSGVGALAGGLVAAWVMRRTSERGLITISLVVMALAYAPMLMTGWLPVVLPAMVLLGAGTVGINVGEAALIQRRTPRELLGRVKSALDLAVLSAQAVSIAAGAALVAVVDFRILLLVMALGLLVAAATLVGDRLTRPRPAPPPADPVHCGRQPDQAVRSR